jgi:hypothetical protein
MDSDSTPTTAADHSAVVIIRHSLATLAYRASKAVRGAPADFATLRVGSSSRTPGEILAHMGDLMEWALTIADNRTVWRDQPPQDWSVDVARLFAGIRALDAFLEQNASIELPVLLQLLQGPIADALTHTGQLTFLRRIAHAPVRGESYQRALIAAGQTGLDQPAPQREFD